MKKILLIIFVLLTCIATFVLGFYVKDNTTKEIDSNTSNLEDIVEEKNSLISDLIKENESLKNNNEVVSYDNTKFAFNLSELGLYKNNEYTVFTNVNDPNLAYGIISNDMFYFEDSYYENLRIQVSVEENFQQVNLDAYHYYFCRTITFDLKNSSVDELESIKSISLKIDGVDYVIDMTNNVIEINDVNCSVGLVILPLENCEQYYTQLYIIPSASDSSVVFNINSLEMTSFEVESSTINL